LTTSPGTTEKRKSLATSGQRCGGASTARSVKRRRTRASERHLGDLGTLPTEILELVLLNLNEKDLGALTATSSYFTASGIVERVAEAKLVAAPRGEIMAQLLGERDSCLKALHHCVFAERAERAASNVSLGAFHTACVVKSEDAQAQGKSIVTFGRGFHGQLGLGSFESQLSPTALTFGDDLGAKIDENSENGSRRQNFRGIDSITLGAAHCVALAEDGGVISWGLASSGELGHWGTTPIELNVPRRVHMMDTMKITQVSAGSNHTLAVSSDGSLYSCGRGRNGQLGQGHFDDGGPMRKLRALRGMTVVNAVAGGSHSMCITSDGHVWAWGDCKYGQLGLGNLAFANTAGWTAGIPWPCLVESLNDMDEPVVQMAAGGAHSLFVTTGGRLYACGRGKYGALGLSPHAHANRLQPVEVNIHHFVRSSNGKIVTNRVQQCSCGRRCRVAYATAGALHSCILTSCGAVFTAGDDAYGQLGHGCSKRRYVFNRVEALKGKKVIAISSGHHHTGAIVEQDGDSNLYVWGRGDWGQLGVGNDRSYNTPQELKSFKVAPPRPAEKFLMYQQIVDERSNGVNGRSSRSESSDEEG